MNGDRALFTLPCTLPFGLQTVRPYGKMTPLIEAIFAFTRKRDKSELPLGCLFGLRWDYVGQLWHFQKNISGPATPEICQFMCDVVKVCRPEFECTSIQVNENVATVLHVDKNNEGPIAGSSACAHTGGEFYAHGAGGICVLNTWRTAAVANSRYD